MSDADGGRFGPCPSCGRRKTIGLPCVSCNYTAQPQLRGRCDCGAPLFDDDGESCARCTRAAAPAPTLDGAVALSRLARRMSTAGGAEGRAAARAGGDAPGEFLADHGRYAEAAGLLWERFRGSA